MSRNFELLQQVGQPESSAATDVGSGPDNEQWSGPVESAESVAVTLPEMGEQSREQVAKLVRQLFQSPAGGRTVVFAGVEHGNGGSWMTVHCARMLAAQTEGAVCVMDGNLRAPTLHEYFGVSNHHGLSDLMRQGGSIRKYVQRLEGMRNLWLMSCGSPVGPDGPGGLLSLDALRPRIQELRTGFEYVLIHAPAVSPDGLALGPW